MKYHTHKGRIGAHPTTEKHKNKKTQEYHNKNLQKKVEYIPSNNPNGIVVKFNKETLETMTRLLEKSGAQEIGITVEPQ